MANIVFKVGSLDLSSFVRVNPGESLDLGQGDMLDPAFSDSPFFEGQALTSVHVKNKELHVPLFLHPPTAPYTNDALNQIVQQLNQALRPVADLGLTVYAEWRNAQATNSTFFTIQYGRFEPNYNFRITEKGWLAGILHLWVLPYGHTATERIISTWAAPSMQSGFVIPGASIIEEGFSGLPSAGVLPVATNVIPDPNFAYKPLGLYTGGPWSPTANNQFLLSGASPQVIATAPPASLVPTILQASQALLVSTASSTRLDGVCIPFSIPTTPAGVTYAMSIFARGASGGESIEMGIGGGSSVDSKGTVIVLGTQWQQYTFAWAGTAGYPTNPWFYSRNNASSPLSYMLWGGFAQSSSVVPIASYFDGESPQAFWIGTPGNSAQALMASGVQGVLGDVPPQMDLRVQVGSYLSDDGRVGIISALPVASYNPIIPVGSFFGLSQTFNSIGPTIMGASGAWASQFLAFDFGPTAGATTGRAGYFSVALSPASVYAGDNRVLGLVRARRSPFGLRAFDSSGNPLGPTVIASAMYGWQLVDYGVVRCPPWQGTTSFSIVAYGGIDSGASGMFAPKVAAPAWTKEHGAIFVIPNQSSVLDLDWNSPLIAADGFDQASGALLHGQYDQFGNQWNAIDGFTNVGALGGDSGFYTPTGVTGHSFFIGSAMAWNDYEVEGVITLQPSSLATGGVFTFGGLIGTQNAAILQDAAVQILIPTSAPTGLLQLNLSQFTQGSIGFNVLPGQYHVRIVARGAQGTAYMTGPSGAYPGSASGVPLVLGGPRVVNYSGSGVYAGFQWTTWGQPSQKLEAFRARALASTGLQARDFLHLHQPLVQNTRMTPSSIDAVDLQSRQRGPVQAPQLPVPSLGGGLFVASFPWDQGPANDLLNVDLRLRERFTYAR